MEGTAFGATPNQTAVASPNRSGFPVEIATHERPLAAPGLISYRCRGPFGWIMIGATDDDDALCQALRSTSISARSALKTLQRWNGNAYEGVAPDDIALAPVDLRAGTRLGTRELRYELLHHLKRVRELSARHNLESDEVVMLRDSRAILRGEADCSSSVNLSDAQYLATLETFARQERERRAKPFWEPDWSQEVQLGPVLSVADAMDRYYKHDRLNRPGGARDRLIADRELELDEKGFACVASHHDSTNGQVVYLRSIDGALSVWSTRLP